MMTTGTTTPQHFGTLAHALPFWCTLLLVPIAWLSAVFGGWTLVLLPVATWGLFSVLDAIKGLDTDNPDPDTPDAALFWYKAITLVWPPVQAVTLFGVIGYVTARGHLAWWELMAVAFGLGILGGTVGIVYAHELIHRQSRLERWLGDILMAMALYSHFRTEHLLVHHRYVGTPRDTVTARYNENFHRFFLRVLKDALPSAWRTEATRLAKKGRPVWDRRNPFWRYGALQLTCLAAAFVVGGWLGLGLFIYAAFIAIWQLELVDYVEHYGLTRKHLGGGKYEPTRPHHSWNASHKASNWLLINLQRHSDHHTKPSRRFPVLQAHGPDEAPQLPYGYPLTTLTALIPSRWRKIMNPRVRAWRKQFYPEIEDWRPYNRGETPLPR